MQLLDRHADESCVDEAARDGAEGMGGIVDEIMVLAVRGFVGCDRARTDVHGMAQLPRRTGERKTDLLLGRVR